MNHESDESKETIQVINHEWDNQRMFRRNVWH